MLAVRELLLRHSFLRGSHQAERERELLCQMLRKEERGPRTAIPSVQAGIHSPKCTIHQDRQRAQRKMESQVWQGQ